MIYLDHHSTTPLDPQVFEAMKPYFMEEFGNASSRNHRFGWNAEKAVETARAQVARTIGASPKEIVFTSGATESNNLALLGFSEFNRTRGDHLVVGSIEHKSVLDSCSFLEKRGFRVTYLPADKWGQISAQKVSEAVNEKTILVSIMMANNEVGTINPVTEIGRICRERKIIFHSDCAQALGILPIDVGALNIDLLSISGHKIYGPKGVGALYARNTNPRIKISPLIHGGGQERGLRPGTLNVPGIVGLGAACILAEDTRVENYARLQSLRDQLQKTLISRLGGVSVNGHPTERLPHNLNVSFEGIDGESLFRMLGNLAVSSGAACSTAAIEPSHVLTAMGIADRLAHASIRFGLGRSNQVEDVETAINAVVRAVGTLRGLFSDSRYSPQMEL